MIKNLAIIALVSPVALMQAMERVTAGAKDSTALSKNLLNDAGLRKGQLAGAFPEQESSEMKARRLKMLVIGYVSKGGDIKEIQNCLSSGAKADLELPGACKYLACKSCERCMSCMNYLQFMEKQLNDVQGLKTWSSFLGLELRQALTSSGKVPQMAREFGLSDEDFLSRIERMLKAIENGAIARIQEVKQLLQSTLDDSDEDDSILDQALDEMDREEHAKNDMLAQDDAGNKGSGNIVDPSKSLTRKKKPAPQKESSWSSWFSYKTVGLTAVGIVALVAGKKYFYDKEENKN